MQIAHRQLSALHQFWDLRRGERPMPARRDFLAEDFAPWFGHIGMVKVESHPVRFKVVLAGVEIVEYDGRDFTGHYLDEVVPDFAYPEIAAPYHRLLETAQPVFDRIAPGRHPGTMRSLDRLLLPCSTDGTTIDRIIIGIYAVLNDGESIYEMMKAV